MIQENYDLTCYSLLDTDAYKFYMQQAVFYYYSNVTVVGEFFCRGNNNFGRYAGILIDKIKMMSNLSLTEKEYSYMCSFPFFTTDYLVWLKKFRYNINQLEIKNYHGRLKITINGLWKEVILWEVPILSLISEIIHKDLYPKINVNHAMNQLNLELLNFFSITKNIDLSSLKIVDFGTRRRFSHQVHFSIIKELKNNFPWFIGSSNYYMSHQFNLTPFGTQSHEWFQAHQQISPVLRDSQILALKIWLKQYKMHLNIALTDCINMDSFLKDFTKDLAQDYQGLRHDSGDPIIWGEKAILHYQKLGIDPTKKTLFFSDNLNFRKIANLYKYFKDRINVTFGIGTYLTCNIPNVIPLNIVIKLIKCNGKPVAKISDSPGKITYSNKNFYKILKKSFNIL